MLIVILPQPSAATKRMWGARFARQRSIASYLSAYRFSDFVTPHNPVTSETVFCLTTVPFKTGGTTNLQTEEEHVSENVSYVWRRRNGWWVDQ
jgi:hypothetical protein